jgi:hypothetical protein
VLHDDGLSYGYRLEQFSLPLFLKLGHEQTRQWREGK